MTPVDAGTVLPDVARFHGLVRVGAWVALASVAMIALQVGCYLVAPPPDTTVGFFELLVENPAYGLITLDLLYVVSNLLAYLLYLALAVVLWRVSLSGVVVALAFGTLGMAAYMASPRAVEMLTLARAYDGADAAERVALVATGDGMLATWTGTAFDVYYVFNLVTLLVLAVLLMRSRVFSRATAWWGLAAAVLMAVPSNVGVVGLAFAMASLVPWSVFAVLVGRRLLRLLALSGGADGAAPA
ncbi:DUF4386 family protein [Actinotalea fermentans]|uniref:DUF4386 domain-containing protein n=1 Tax=Actinotalea fermentans TaxID=43671 RepID=A0A511YTB9_9CELL|nr:DUF4386 family protein [Actinotalea fermentans]KGM17359.1 hypothetical protein N867_05255 [Actinotalea fermentans ATCC 43279 = JCM 9966 = DSM 3133]GEN78440.1 hypothetical protein AFE02nite_01740 [Actinotalea fermentans]